jgi:hypothetical protein
MIEELEQYAKESKVDELFRDIMTGCFKTRPAAPVKYILEYLASAYPEESYAHARAFIDLKEGILVADDEQECDDVVYEPECAGEAEVVCDIVEAPLMVEDTAAAPKANDAAPHDAAPAEECDDVDEGVVDENESQINIEDVHDKHEGEDKDEEIVAEDSQDPDVGEAEDHEERVDISDEDNDKDNQEEVTLSESSDDTAHDN